MSWFLNPFSCCLFRARRAVGQEPPALDALLSTNAGFMAFGEYLAPQAKHIQNKLMFWKECQELKIESNPDLIWSKCNSINKEYLAVMAKREIFEDPLTQEELKMVSRLNIAVPSTAMFDEIQEYVYHRLLELYPQFLKSGIYRKFVEDSRVVQAEPEPAADPPAAADPAEEPSA